MAGLAVDALMPRWSVKMESIPDPAVAGGGYLAMYVERSDRRPHRCQFGEKQYYRRAGSSSRMMEHFEIEDAFKRRATAHLDANYDVRSEETMGGPQGSTATVLVVISLFNSSATSAR
jgi:hypothetical protein